MSTFGSASVSSSSRQSVFAVLPFANTPITTTTQAVPVFRNFNGDNITTSYRKLDTENSENFHLPSKVSASLKCSCCQAYLSCGPVREQNGKYICGRCPAIAEDGISAQSVFELAMAKFTFPCRFDINGCDENILFNQIKDHESKCFYRNVQCPSLNCTTLISATKLYDHFLEFHVDSVIKNYQFKLDLQKNSGESLLINDSDQLILVKYTFCEESKSLKLHISVIVERIRKINKFKLQFLSDIDSDSSINLPPKLCHVHNSENLDSVEYDSINMNNYLPVLNYSKSIIIGISFQYSDDALLNSTDQVNCETLSIPESDDSYEQNAVEFMKTNICSTCRNSPTLCTCNPPTNICSECLRSSPFCTCNHLFRHSEPKPAPKPELNDIPCQWKGCKTIGNKQRIINHQKDCKFKLHVCPFLETCDKGIFSFNLSYLEHLKTHAQYCSDSKKIVIPLYHSNLRYKKEKVYNYFTILNQTVVRLTCTISPNDWAINCSSEDTLKATMDLTHEHCRFVASVCISGTTISFKKSGVAKAGCFDKFPRLTACIGIVLV